MMMRVRIMMPLPLLLSDQEAKDARLFDMTWATAERRAKSQESRSAFEGVCVCRCCSPLTMERVWGRLWMT